MIAVTGVGRVSVPADMASIDLGINVLAASAADASAGAATLATELHDAIRRLGVVDGDLSTSGYSVFQEHDHRSGRAELRGYRVNNTMHVVVRDLDTVPVLLEAAVAVGGESIAINGVSFGLSDDADARVAAREAAWADASSRAGHLATLAGITLGPVSSIDEQAGRFTSPKAMRRGRAMTAEAAPPPIEAGDTSVEVTLAVEFAIV